MNLPDIKPIHGLFLAKDIAEFLGYNKPSNMTRKLPKSELKKQLHKSRSRSFITPRGLISLSRKIEDDTQGNALIDLAVSVLASDKVDFDYEKRIDKVYRASVNQNAKMNSLLTSLENHQKAMKSFTISIENLNKENK